MPPPPSSRLAQETSLPVVGSWIMGRYITLEICIDSLESAVKIQQVSAQFSERVPWRVELCSNLINGGGLTPSVGLLRACRALLQKADIMVMIRPRAGSFVYTNHELETMASDITALGQEGASGFVFGCLTPDGSIDRNAMDSLRKAIDNRPVTFHRAFDLTHDVQLAYRDLQQLGSVTRVLTSGHGRNVTEGLPELQALSAAHAESSANRVSILPGSGINGDMLPDFLSRLPLITEIHLSASEAVDEASGRAKDRGVELGFGNGKVWALSEQKLKSAFQAVFDMQDR